MAKYGIRKQFRCSRCGKYKSQDKFYKVVTDISPPLRGKFHPITVSNIESPRGNVNYVCKVCDKQYLKEWYKKNKTKAVGTSPRLKAARKSRTLKTVKHPHSKTYYDKMKALRDAGDAKGLEWWDKQLELSSQYRKRKQLETVNVKIEKLQAELKMLKTKKAELRK